MRLLVITQTVDPRDPTLGFFVTWLRHLAPLVERLEVVCSRLGAVELPGNVRCHSLGKEAGANRWQRWCRFHRAVRDLILGGQVDAVFAHMCPEYVLAVAPDALRARVPIVLWYAHRQVTWQLRLAHRLAARVVTAVSESFPFCSRKLTVLGHGIDTDYFQPAHEAVNRPPSHNVVMAAGRLAPIKRYGLFLRSAARIVHHDGRRDIQFLIAGGDAASGSGATAAFERQVSELQLSAYVTVAGSIPHHRMADYYRSSHLLVNLTPPGSFDKVVLEAMACGLPALVTNPAFAPLLGPYAAQLVSCEAEPQRLAARLSDALALADRHPEVKERLRTVVVAAHDVQRLSRSLVGVFREIFQP